VNTITHNDVVSLAGFGYLILCMRISFVLQEQIHNVQCTLMTGNV